MWQDDRFWLSVTLKNNKYSFDYQCKRLDIEL